MVEMTTVYRANLTTTYRTVAHTGTHTMVTGRCR